MSTDSIASRILKSSFWEYLGSWVNRLIGFASTLILARVLVPDDFGVVAAASIVTGLFHVLAVVGTDQYLIRRKEIKYSEYNTGWTINIIMKSISSLAIFLLAEPISLFMEDERLFLVLQVSCIVPLLHGFINIGMVMYEKEYNYRPKFILLFSSRIVGFIVKISLAIHMRSYWVFIIAEIVEATILMFGSFILHKFRPRFSLAGWRQQWVFSQWILLKSIFVFLRFRVDNIFISKYLPLESLGVYTVGKEVATLPAGQIIEPIMQPLYVGLSAIQDDKEMFADKVHKALSMLFFIVFPISFGTYITANNLVYVLLGEQWQHANSIVLILSFMLVPVTLGGVFTRVMTAMGKVRLVFKFELLLSILTVSAFFLLATEMTLDEIAQLRVVLITFDTFFVLLVLTNLSSLSFFRILALLIIPLLASVFMAYVIMNINPYITEIIPIYQLIIQVSVGMLSYLIFSTFFISILRNYINEFQFIWKTFYLPFAFWRK